MKCAYLLLVHNNPGQLKRLMGKLAGADTDIYIHVDHKASLPLFQEELKDFRVSFVQKRVNVHWGGYSLIQATLNGFREIIDAGIEYDRITLLSGQDYPIKSRQFIRDFFAAHPGKAFMLFESIENEWKEALPRLNRYFLTDHPFPGSTTLEGWINSWLPARKPPANLVFVGRSQWFSITLAQVKFIWETLNANRKLVAYLRYTWGSDEFVFQTLLYNSVFRSEMVNDNLRYADWSSGGASPRILRKEDAAALSASKALFARKFDEAVDAGILDELDKW